MAETPGGIALTPGFPYTVPALKTFIFTMFYGGGTQPTLAVGTETVAVVGNFSSSYKPVAQPIAAGPGDVLSVTGGSATVGLSGVFIETALVTVNHFLDTGNPYTVPGGFVFEFAAFFVGGSNPSVIIDGVTTATLGLNGSDYDTIAKPLAAPPASVISAGGISPAIGLSGFLVPV